MLQGFYYGNNKGLLFLYTSQQEWAFRLILQSLILSSFSRIDSGLRKRKNPEVNDHLRICQIGEFSVSI